MRQLLPSAAVLLALAFVDMGRAAETKLDLNANAALKYWRGFAHLPKLDKEEQETLQNEVTTLPLTPRIREVVKMSEGSLRELYNGAAIPTCAWGITYEDGISVSLNECPAARLLAATALLRARLRFEDGKPGEAIDDVFATLTLARHMSSGSIINLLVGIAIEQKATEVLAAHLPKLDAATLKGLPARLDNLPARGNMADELLREEKVFLGWFAKKVQGIKDRNQLVEFLDYCQGGAGKKDEFAMGKAMLESSGGTAENVLKYVEESRPFYASYARMMKLPPEELEKQVEAERQKTDKNPVFKLLSPGLVKCRQAEIRSEITHAMLRTAIAVQLEGKEALKSYPAPFGQGKFDYEPFDGGFELKSKFQVKDQPWKLTVGKRK